VYISELAFSTINFGPQKIIAVTKEKEDKTETIVLLRTLD
jgi:hypothetical protein